MKRGWFPWTIGCLFLLLAFGPLRLPANQEKDALETARLLAVLLDSGRVTIAQNQDLINDPAKGDKGFTPDVFETQLEEEFHRRTGLSLTDLDQAAVPSMAKPLLNSLIRESRKTIADHQVVINLPGVRSKGLIPFTFGTETAARFRNWSGIYLKQTAPSTLVRNPKNAPDAFETEALSQLAERSSDPRLPDVYSQVVDEGHSMRVLLPLYYGESCLACHGEPKGVRDSTGYLREGGKVGDLGGAISVKIPLK